MRTQSIAGAAVVAALGLSAAIIAGCGHAPEAAAAGGEAAAAPRAARVAIITPERAALRRTTAQPGQIEAYEVTNIHAKLAGYVAELAVDIGDEITKGQAIARLHIPELEAELEQKRAAVEQAEADRKQAEAAVAVAEASVVSAEAGVTEAQAATRRTEADVARWQAEYNRIAQLVRESAVTGSLLDETRSKLAAARAAGEEARAQVESARAALAEATARLEKAHADAGSAAAAIKVAHSDARRVESLLGYATIEAPYDGVVTRRNVDTGHLTVPGGQGEPLFVVARTNRVTVSVGVPEADAALVGPGDRAEVRLQALDGRTVEGRVTRTSWSLDRATRTLRAEIDLPNPDGGLRPGLYAYATIVAEERPDALTLPKTAIVRHDGETYCVIVADGRAHRREIVPGLSDGTRTEVVSGLDGKEAVVKAEVDSLAEGQPVEPIQPEEATPKAAKP